MRVLLLESDAETASALARGLKQEGHRVSVATDVASALARVEAAPPDVAILDAAVSGRSGFEVLQRIRDLGARSRVLMLAARGSAPDRDAGPHPGADGYLPKPFSFAELTAALHALGPHEGRAVLRACDLELVPKTGAARVRGEPLDLTPTEFRILATLLRSQGRTVSRKELLREVWSYEFELETNLVDVHVDRLRRKLEGAGLRGLIRSVRSRGYAVD